MNKVVDSDTMTEFKTYLLSKGFNEYGAGETINRFKENRPDEMDMIQYRQFTERSDHYGTY